MREVASQKGINLEDCNDIKCFSELAELLGISQVVIGKIEKLDEFEYVNGSPFALNISMLDIKGNSILSNKDKRFTGDAEVLMNEIQISAWEIVGAEIPRALLKKRNGESAVNKDELKKIFLSEVPTEIYPEIEKKFFEIVKSIGYPEIKLEKKELF